MTTFRSIETTTPALGERHRLPALLRRDQVGEFPEGMKVRSVFRPRPQPVHRVVRADDQAAQRIERHADQRRRRHDQLGVAVGRRRNSPLAPASASTTCSRPTGPRPAPAAGRSANRRATACRRAPGGTRDRRRRAWAPSRTACRRATSRDETRPRSAAATRTARVWPSGATRKIVPERSPTNSAPSRSNASPHAMPISAANASSVPSARHAVHRPVEPARHVQEAGGIERHRRRIDDAARRMARGPRRA